MKTKLILFLLIVSMLFVAAADFPPPLPSSFYGTVKVNGANVPIGTVVSAWIAGVQMASGNSILYGGESVYFFNVPTGPENAVIIFKVAGKAASQTALWHSGTNVNLNLTVTESKAKRRR
jgi:hypothetical protein